MNKTDAYGLKPRKFKCPECGNWSVEIYCDFAACYQDDCDYEQDIENFADEYCNYPDSDSADREYDSYL